MKFHFVGCIIAIATLVMPSCAPQIDAPDVSAIDLDINWIRFEQLLSAIDSNRLEAEVDQLATGYPDFTDVFFYQVIADPRDRNDIYRTARNFLSDPYIRRLVELSDSVFTSFDSYQSDIEQALKYFHHYFPQYPVPNIYTCVTGFEVGSFTIGERLLGIGLEFYLGTAFKHYDPNLFPEYIQRTMDGNYLVAKSMQSLIANYLGETRGTMLLDFMIRNGIELYVKKRLLPFAPDSIIHEFTGEQLDWLVENEAQIWAHLLDEELLHSNNYRQFQKLVTPSPNVPNMPPQAPGRVANWMGYKIVESYVDRHPEKTLLDLISFDDAQKILAESRYKPRQSI